MSDKKYKVGSDVYDIPEMEVPNFLKEFPKAIELETFVVGKNTFDIPVNEIDGFLTDFPKAKSQKKKDVSEVTGMPSEISLPEQPPLPSEKPITPERKTSVVGDLLRTFKSTSLRVLGGLAATPMFINRSIAAYTVRPIIKAMGGTDEEAEYVINNLTATSTIGQSMMLTEAAQAPLNRAAQKTEEKMAIIEGGIASNLFKGKDGEKDVAAGFENLGRTVVGAIPYSLMTAATAGGGTIAVLGTMSATTAAQQYAEKEGKLPEGKRVLNSWMYGGFEGIGEAMSAVIFRGIGRTFRAGLKKTISETNASSFAKGVASALGIESSSEAITQIGQNFTAIVTGEDPERSILDGALDAAIGGAAFGFVLGGGGHAGASVLGRTLASDKETEQVQENFKQQEVLIDQIDQTDSDPVKNALKKSIKDLQFQADEVMDANFELAQKLSPEEQNQVAELYSVWNELQDKIDTGKLTEQQIPAMDKTIGGIKDQIQTIKENLITRLEEEAKAEKEAKVDEIKEKQETELDKLKKKETKELDKVKDVGEGEKVNKKKLDEVKEKYDTKVEEVKTKTEEELTKVEEEEDAETIRRETEEAGRPQELVEGEEERLRLRRAEEDRVEAEQREEVKKEEIPLISEKEIVPLQEKSVEELEFKKIKRDEKNPYHLIDFNTIDDIINQATNSAIKNNISLTSSQFYDNIASRMAEADKTIVNKRFLRLPFIIKDYIDTKEAIKNSLEGEISEEETIKFLSTGSRPKEFVENILQIVKREKTPQEKVLPTPEQLEEKEVVTPVPPEVPPIEKAEEPEGEAKFRKTQINSLIQDQTLQQQEVTKIVDANKERYEVLHQADAVVQAKVLIDELGVQGATLDLAERTKKMDEFPVRQVARQVLLDFYSRAIIDPNASEADKKVAFKNIDNLQQITAREATRAGQGSALLQIWKSMQPAGVLEFVVRKIRQSNDLVLGKKVEDTTIGQQIDELYDTLNEESKKIIDDILAGKEIIIPKERVAERPLRKSVPRERIKQEQDYRRNLLSEYKKKAKTISVSAVGLSSEQIELGGNLVASYVREGFYRTQDIIDKLIRDFKIVGVDLDKAQTDGILDRSKDGKQTYREYLTTEEAKTGIKKEIGKQINDVIKKHWSEKDELRRTLAQKLVDEAGLSEADAKRLETSILAEFDKMILEKSQKQLTKILGTEKIPVEKAKKGIIGKMIELINMGALDETLYRNLFAEKFNLIELTDQHKEEILRLASNVQLSSGRGWLERDATIKLAKYIFELYPAKRSAEMLDTWISMTYANMLFGPSTSILNMWSAGWNMALKPFRDLTNISKYIKLVKEGKREGNIDIYNPFGEMAYLPALRGISLGWDAAKEVYLNGDLNNKYIEQVARKNQFKVSQLERDKYGKAKRFKPVEVKIGGRTIDLNIFNLYKYAGRNLSAQDKLMLTTSYEIEIAHILRDKLKNKNLKGGALTKEVMAVFRGDHIDMEQLNKTLLDDVNLYKRLTGEEMTNLQKGIRKRELILEELPITKEERDEAERLARSNIFTDDRGGLFGTVASGLGYLVNSSITAALIVKPFVPFTKVVGNVAEYMMDHVPYYGILRANGMGVISIIKKRIDPELMTAQMGERGSRAYYEQMGRAYLGTIAFSLGMMFLLGRDEDDFVEVSGGYNKEGFRKRGRENVLPPYTLRIGSVKIPYKNIPGLAIPLCLIGNLNDGLRDKRDEGELQDRLTAALLLDATTNSIFMVKDMSFLDGVQRGTQIIADAASADEKKWGQIGEGLVKSYLGFTTRPLPQNNNAIQQIWKLFDPTSYSQGDIRGMLGYAAGLQHFLNKPVLDQFGEEISSYPGETLLPYTHWLKIKGQDKRWGFLAKYNAIPSRIYNRTMSIETKDGIEKRQLEVDELHDYTEITGKMFSESIVQYMADKEKVTQRGATVIEREKLNGETEKVNGVKEDVEKLWARAKDNAELELFRWGSVKEEMPKIWDLIKKHQAFQLYQTSKSTEGYNWSKSELYEFNNLATLRYAEKMEKYLLSDRVGIDKTKDSDKDGMSNFEEKIDSIWADAKSYVGSKMERQIKKKAQTR